MYGNSEIDKKEQLKAAVRNRDFSTQVAEQSFNELLVKDNQVEESSVTPSKTTLEYIDYKEDVQVKESTSLVIKEKYTISARGKALIALYAFLLISIFAAIIFNVTFLRGLDNSIKNAEKETASIQLQYEMQKEYYELIKSPEYIIQEAIEMGMIK